MRRRATGPAGLGRPLKLCDKCRALELVALSACTKPRDTPSLTMVSSCAVDSRECRRQDDAQQGRYLLVEIRSNRGSEHVTALLRAWTSGEIAARDELMLVVYEELRVRAAARLRRERSGHLLQPTALVNEAYLRLVGSATHGVAESRALLRLGV